MTGTLTVDDLNRDIPAPADGSVGRVIVIGAGISGLAAANALANAGVDVVVLEGRERIGGRLHTVDVAGSYTDLGGSWIHHPIGNPLTPWVEHLGLATYDGDPGARTGFDQATATALSPAEIGRIHELREDGFGGWLAAQESAGVPDKPADEFLADYLATLDLPTDETARLGQSIRLGIEADAAEVAHRVSGYWLGHLGDYDGPNLGPKPVGGYRKVLEPLAAGLAVVTGFTVATIAQDADGVAVTAADGRIERGSQVVSTIPFGVLQRGVVTFEPALPPRIAEVLERQTFSSMEKVVLAFAEPFWRSKGFRQAEVFPVDRDESSIAMYDFRDEATPPLVVFQYFASSHPHAVGTSDANAVEWALQMLRDLTGGPVPTPLSYVVTRWRDDPYAYGSYTHAVPGSVAEDDYGQFATPHGRVLFAGEHTSGPRGGYADGGMLTGLREAKRLLQRPGVELTAP